MQIATNFKVQSAKKKLSVVLAGSMLAAALSGCMAVDATVTINQNGSVNVESYFGVEATSLREIASMQFDSETLDSMSMSQIADAMFDGESEQRTYGSYTYYGAMESADYATLAEFNQEMRSTTHENDSTISWLTIEQSGSTFTMTMDFTETTADDITSSGMFDDEDLDIGELDEELKNAFVYVMKFEFPSEMKQTVGTSVDGITVSGKTVTLDLIKASAGAEGTVLKFSSVASEPVEAKSFPDVTESSWCYKAVQACAAGGLVDGYDNGNFGPNDTLSVAQFCQILARAAGLEVGRDGNGYWAGKAIQACIDKGYIADMGEVTAKNYSGPISREAAIAAMQRASGRSAIHSYTAADIPDYESISAQYQSDILAAFNSGITTGVNSSRTFLPSNHLTRAQICQLLYNANWTTAK